MRMPETVVNDELTALKWLVRMPLAEGGANHRAERKRKRRMRRRRRRMTEAVF